MELGVRPTTKLRHAIGWMLLASFFSATTGLLVKLSAPFTPLEMIVFFRCGVGLVLMLPWLYFFNKERSFKENIYSPDWRMHLVRGIAAIFSLYLFFYALEFLPLSDAVLLSNTMPIFVPFVLFLWKGKPMYHQIWWGISLAFVGIIVILQPGNSVFQLASIYAIASAMIGAVSTVTLRFAHYTEPATRSVFYYFLITGVLAGLISILSPNDTWSALSWKSMLYLVPLGLSGIGWQFCFTQATRSAPIRITTIFLYAAVIISIFYDWLIWNIDLDLSLLVGFLLISAGAILTVYLFPKENL